MAFENLSDKLNNVFKNLRGKGRLSEQLIHMFKKGLKKLFEQPYIGNSEKAMAPHSSTSCLENPMDGGAC